MFSPVQALENRFIGIPGSGMLSKHFGHNLGQKIISQFE